MFQVAVAVGNANDFNALAFGQKHPGTLQFLETQVAHAENLMSNFTAAGSQFMSRAREVFNSFNGADASRLAKAAANKFNSVFQTNRIRPLLDLSEMQSACLTMQRWIMAEPTVREMFHRQRVAGFSDSYIDMEPDSIGSTHYDYQRVMDGMLVETDNGGYEFTHYFDPKHEEDHTLDIVDKVDILSTWDMVKVYLERNEEDPTDPFCGRL